MQHRPPQSNFCGGRVPRGIYACRFGVRVTLTFRVSFRVRVIWALYGESVCLLMRSVLSLTASLNLVNSVRIRDSFGRCGRWSCWWDRWSFYKCPYVTAAWNTLWALKRSQCLEVRKSNFCLLKLQVQKLVHECLINPKVRSVFCIYLKSERSIHSWRAEI